MQTGGSLLGSLSNGDGLDVQYTNGSDKGAHG